MHFFLLCTGFVKTITVLINYIEHYLVSSSHICFHAISKIMTIEIDYLIASSSEDYRWFVFFMTNNSHFPFHSVTEIFRQLAEGEGEADFIVARKNILSLHVYIMVMMMRERDHESLCNFKTSFIEKKKKPTII